MRARSEAFFALVEEGVLLDRWDTLVEGSVCFVCEREDGLGSIVDEWRMSTRSSEGVLFDR